MGNPYDCGHCHNEGYDHALDCPYHPENLKAVTRNRRVQRLLDAARKHGWKAEHKHLSYSSGDSECWVLRPEPNPEGLNLTVYPGRNHSATVYADIPSNRDWAPITQRHALWLMFERRATLLESPERDETS